MPAWTDQLVECVPNFSEGRRPEVIERICAAIEDGGEALVLDRSLDPDHNRSVVTFVAPPAAAVAAAVRAVRIARDEIDLRDHEGVHPRMGAADVVPFVPLRGVTMEDCVEVARRAAAAIGDELAVPCFLYGEAAARPERANLADVRRPRFEGLRDLVGSDPAWAPDAGPAALHESAGATAVGARFFLVAFNVDLASDDLDLARRIAREVRESSGGLPTIKAIGLRLEERGRVQVSMNVCDYRVTSLATVFREVSRRAEEAGVRVAGSELIGLLPKEAWDATASGALALPPASADRLIESRLDARQRAMGPPLGLVLGALASDAPTPGGGFAAGLAGSLAAALAAMASRISAGKAKDEETRAELVRAVGSADALGKTLLALAHRDAAAYGRLHEAWGMPRGTDEEKARRDEEIDQASRAAAAVPLEIAEMAARTTTLAALVLEKGRASLAVDVGTTALLAAAAAASARLMVLVNLPSIVDEDERARLRELADRHVELADRAAATVGAKVEVILSGGDGAG